MSSSEYNELETYVRQIYEACSQVKSTDQKLTADLSSLLEHIGIMTLYLQNLWQYKTFKDLFPTHTTFHFIQSIALLHDFSRFVFNGSLRVTDIISDLLLETLFPEFPSKKYLHSIKWLTNESAPSKLYKHPVILKAIDSLGKAYRDPKLFFKEKGGYKSWLRFQVENGRFPLVIKNGSGVTYWVHPNEYAARDEKYTLAGVAQIEAITGQSFSKLQKKVLSQYSDCNYSGTEYFGN